MRPLPTMLTFCCGTAGSNQSALRGNAMAALVTSIRPMFICDCGRRDFPLVDLHGIYDLRPLNEILADEGLEPVSAGGLGED